MDAKSLTADQRGAVRRRVLRHRKYLGKLVARLESLAWRTDDPMRVAAVQSRDAAEAMLKALEDAEPPAPFLPPRHRADGALGNPSRCSTFRGRICSAPAHKLVGQPGNSSCYNPFGRSFHADASE